MTETELLLPLSGRRLEDDPSLLLLLSRLLLFTGWIEVLPTEGTAAASDTADLRFCMVGLGQILGGERLLPTRANVPG